jgi:hypothetical protein
LFLTAAASFKLVKHDGDPCRKESGKAGLKRKVAIRKQELRNLLHGAAKPQPKGFDQPTIVGERIEPGVERGFVSATQG